jgi:hypothetical protein
MASPDSTSSCIRGPNSLGKNSDTPVDEALKARGKKKKEKKREKERKKKKKKKKKEKKKTY